jgi:hypothetical protein
MIFFLVLPDSFYLHLSMAPDRNNISSWIARALTLVEMEHLYKNQQKGKDLKNYRKII